MAGKSKSKESDLLEEAIKNIRDDRDLTYEIIGELRGELASNRVSHKEVGFTVAKYLETLQRSNEQMVKIVAIIKRQRGAKDSEDLSEEEADELFTLIKED